MYKVHNKEAIALTPEFSRRSDRLYKGDCEEAIACVKLIAKERSHRQMSLLGTYLLEIAYKERSRRQKL
ncbi:hypothetical protein [Nostoc sp.]|uniref:hypothetical protein n=1 Tax=Nostoc sp. TaxID=1180 RepID=UPI002FFC4E1F